MEMGFECSPSGVYKISPFMAAKIKQIKIVTHKSFYK